MPRLAFCPQGHSWTCDESPDDTVVLACPQCGQAPASVHDAPEQTLSDREPDALADATQLLERAPSADLSSDDALAADAAADSSALTLDDARGRPRSADADDATVVAVAEAHADWPSIPGYTIEGLLARGGMGIVYVARQHGLGRRVALKMLLLSGADQAARLKRFRTEAASIARLQHPNIVQIYEVGQVGATPYLSLELVQGGSLAARCAGVPQPPREAARLVAVLAAAIQVAHEHGIVHRDLKPANVLLTAAGVPKITDFGIAKELKCDAGQTEAGAVLGTAAYMAPEQAMGDANIGPAADIYSLGVILYELLTGRTPFQGPNLLAILDQLKQSEPTPPSRLPGAGGKPCPRDLETICLKCLSKDPARRYASAQELADDLNRFLSDQPIHARPTTQRERLWRWCRRNPALAALSASTLAMLLMLAVGSTVTAVILQGALERTQQAEKDTGDERDIAARNADRAEKNEARATKAEKDALTRLGDAYLGQAQANRLSRRSGQRFQTLEAIKKALKLKSPSLELRNAALACLVLPDIDVAREWEGYAGGLHGVVFDRALKHLARADGKGAVSIRRLEDDVEVYRLPGPGVFAGHGFSPDGRFFAVESKGHVHVWKLTQPKPVEIFSAPGDNAVFRTDKEEVIIGFGFTGMDCALFDLATGKEIRRLPITLNSPEMHRHLPRLAGAAHNVVRIVNPDTGKVVVQSPPLSQKQIYSICWHPDGNLLAAGCEDSRIYFVDARTGQLDGPPLAGPLNFGIALAFSEKGDLLCSNGWNQTLRLWDVRTRTELLSTPMNGRFYRFHESDTRLASAFVGTKAQLLRLASGRELRALAPRHDAPAGTSYHDAQSSPDGRLLAVNTLSGLAIVDVASGAELAWQSLGSTNVLHFDPDGALVTWGNGELLRWPIRLDEGSNRLRFGPPQTLAAPGPGNLGASRDNRVFAHTPLGGDRTRVVHLDTVKSVTLAPQHDVRFMLVSPDGRWVVTCSHVHGGIVVSDTATGKRVKELTAKGGYGSFSPDGRWFVSHAFGDSELVVWQVPSWSEHRRIAGPGSCFAPDSKAIAVVAGTGAVRLVEIETGNELARLDTQLQTPLWPRCFTPDGGSLVVNGADTLMLHVFDLRALRRQLKDLGLDWPGADYPPAPPELAPPRVFIGRAPDFPLLYDFGPNMRFGFTAVDDDGKRRSITYRTNGETNHLLVQMDGKEMEFGGPQGIWDPAKAPLEDAPDGGKRHGLRSTWRFPKLKITQVVEVKSAEPRKPHDVAFVRWIIENKDDKAHAVGLRLLFDTMMDGNDGHPFAVPGMDKLITTSAEFSKDDMPAQVVALEKPDLKNPGLTAVFGLRPPDGVHGPDRFVITQWLGPGDKKVGLPWLIPVRDIGKDAAVVLYWDPVEVPANGTREVGFTLGKRLLPAK